MKKQLAWLGILALLFAGGGMIKQSVLMRASSDVSRHSPHVVGIVGSGVRLVAGIVGSGRAAA